MLVDVLMMLMHIKDVFLMLVLANVLMLVRIHANPLKAFPMINV